MSAQSSARQTSDLLQIGGVVLDRQKAFEAAELYFKGTGEYAYPAYDAYDGGAGPWRLSDGDLLAPVLLNVRTSIAAYYSFTRIRPKLEAWLQVTPLDACLANADDASLQRLGELFALLDEGLPGVGGATFAKVMHRKRPSFVPLYDRYVWWAYVGVEGAPIARDRRRSWAELILLLSDALRKDMHRERSWIGAVAKTASKPPVTLLRALDVVAWRAGKTGSEFVPASETVEVPE
ncbi:DUF6308 family protein [Georgenia wangjunii]|uniref:DUF6308 family protein n=1 Tax=Georgenia wangjunii TaxID=3117730 RepID=UPI002F2641B8